MAYNPEIHDRKSIRLKGYDYSREGAYFITICTHNKEHRFGIITNGEMVHNEMGNVAIAEWVALGERFNHIELGVFVVMPNHTHGILHIIDSSRAGQPQGIAPTVGNMIGAYKSQVANECLDICRSTNKTRGKLWQRNYHEHIIRSEASYHKIANYIINNPASWEEDIFYTKPNTSKT